MFRYLLNDACVFLKKPLVSGSALRWEGQLTVYNYVDTNGEVNIFHWKSIAFPLA